MAPSRLHISQFKVCEDAGRKPASGQIGKRRSPGFRIQKGMMEKLHGLAVDLKEKLPFIHLFFQSGTHGLINDYDAIASGQKSDGFRKRYPFLLHDKGKYIATFAAAKAVKHLLVRAYRKRWCLFRVKRAKSKVISARFFQRNRIRNNLQDIGAVFDFRYFFCRDGVRQEQASKSFRKGKM